MLRKLAIPVLAVATYALPSCQVAGALSVNGTALHSMMCPASPWYGPKVDPSDTASSTAKDLQAADFMFSGILASSGFGLLLSSSRSRLVRTSA